MRPNRLCNQYAWMRLTLRQTPTSAVPHGRPRISAGRLSVGLALLLFPLLVPGPAAATPEREVSLSVAGAYRVYNRPLGLR